MAIDFYVSLHREGLAARKCWFSQRLVPGSERGPVRWVCQTLRNRQCLIDCPRWGSFEVSVHLSTAKSAPKRNASKIEANNNISEGTMDVNA
jgi:hypothetical protein